MNHTGKIMVGQLDGMYLLKLVGDVRVTLCISAEGFFESMLRDANFKSVLVDLSLASGIDSTSLGILAKLSIETQKRFDIVPSLVVTSPELERLLVASGFSDVFHLITETLQHEEQLGELPHNVNIDESSLRRKVIEAHRTLMSLSDQNRETFKDLVAALEAEDEQVTNGQAASGG